MWGTLLNAAISAGKIIGGAKALKNVSDFVTEDRETKKRMREEQERQKKQREAIEGLMQRNIIETLVIYILGGMAGIWIGSKGIPALGIVSIFYLAHINELYKMSKNASLSREWVLTFISIGIFLYYTVIKKRIL